MLQDAHLFPLHLSIPGEALDGAIALNERPIADDVLTAVPIPDYGKVEAIPLLTVRRLGVQTSLPIMAPDPSTATRPACLSRSACLSDQPASPDHPASHTQSLLGPIRHRPTHA